MERTHAGSLLLLLCFSSSLCEPALAHPASRALLEIPTPTPPLPQESEGPFRHEEPAHQHVRKGGVGGALEGLLGFFGSSDSQAAGAEHAAQVALQL